MHMGDRPDRCLQIAYQRLTLVPLGDQLDIRVADAVHQPDVVHIGADSDVRKFPGSKLLEFHSGISANAGFLNDAAVSIQDQAPAIADDGAVEPNLPHDHLHTAGGAGGAENHGNLVLFQTVQQRFRVVRNLVVGIHQCSVNIQQDDRIRIARFLPMWKG